MKVTVHNLLLCLSIFIGQQVFEVRSESRSVHRVENELSREEASCESIKVPFCKHLTYGQTSSSYKHDVHGQVDQDDIAPLLSKYGTLYKSNCSKLLETFVCSYYVPLCVQVDPLKLKLLQPCRELCTLVQNECEPKLAKEKLAWPLELNCNKFVRYQETKMCFLPPEFSNSPQLSSDPPSSKNKSTSRQQAYSSKTEPSNFTCQIELKKQTNNAHVFRIAHTEVNNCAYPCHKFYTEKATFDQARTLILVFAIVGLLFNLVLQIIFWIDRNRFQYPLKAIVNISFCYLMIAIIYLIGHALQDRVACDATLLDHSTLNSSTSNTKTLSNGDKFTCKLSFIFINFFTVCSFLWWIMLAVTFYLEMVHLWATEVFERKSFLFRIIVLMLASVHTGLAIYRAELQGDPLSGLCSMSLDHQFVYIILPQIVLLLFGLLMFAISICYFFKVKQILKLNQIDMKKFESFVFKLLFFLLIYLIAHVAQFMVFYFEVNSFDLWTQNWYKSTCEKYSKKDVCPSWIMNWKPRREHKPTLTFAAFKYLSQFLPCLAVCSVLLSKKAFRVFRDKVSLVPKRIQPRY